MITRHTLLAAGICIALSIYHTSALADCAGATVREVRDAYSKAQTLESQGKHEAALGAYVRAQEYTCELNPVEVDAAKHAATLSLPLATAAEKRGDFAAAFRLYDQGAHYAKADGALMADLRTRIGDPRAYETARSHFGYRTLPAFQSNNAVRLRVVGAYQTDKRLLDEVASLPTKGVGHLLAKDAESFSLDYLRETVAVVQSRPDKVTDMVAVQKFSDAQIAYAQKWQHEPLKSSRQALETLRQWRYVTDDKAFIASVDQSLQRRVEEHVAAISRTYNGAPALLETALDYLALLNTDSSVEDARVNKVKSMATQLGDAALAKQRYLLAAEYFSVAGADEKAQLARERLQQASMQAVQPSMAEMQRQAAQIQAQFSDPEKIKAMQEQALALQKSMQQSTQDQAQRTRTNKKRADDLEKSLGM